SFGIRASRKPSPSRAGFVPGKPSAGRSRSSERGRSRRPSRLVGATSPGRLIMRGKDVMTRGVECLPPSATLQQAAQKMRDLDIGPLPVCGDNDRLVGMLTDRDITVRAVAEGLDPRTTLIRDVMTPTIVYVFEDQDVSEAARLMKEN